MAHLDGIYGTAVHELGILGSTCVGFQMSLSIRGWMKVLLPIFDLAENEFSGKSH
jgi:hypothetical protein